MRPLMRRRLLTILAPQLPVRRRPISTQPIVLKHFTTLTQEALNRPVVASVTPASFETRGNGARAFRVEQVSETRKKNELKIDKTAQFATGRRRDGVPNVSQQPSLAATGNAAFANSTVSRKSFHGLPHAGGGLV